jgi:hypothetical protein
MRIANPLPAMFLGRSLDSKPIQESRHGEGQGGQAGENVLPMLDT